MPKPHFFPSALAFRLWLEAHAATASKWVVGYHKVATGRPSLSWSASVDEALCFGWIDGVRKRIDDERYPIRFTSRLIDSIWSARKPETRHRRFEKLIEACAAKQRLR